LFYEIGGNLGCERSFHVFLRDRVLHQRRLTGCRSQQFLPRHFVELSCGWQRGYPLECTNRSLQVTPCYAVDLARGEPGAVEHDLCGDNIVDSRRLS
jgi:hypothetical protein